MTKRRADMKGKILILAAASVLMAACAPALPDRPAPVDTSLPFSISGTAPLPERWWQGFADDTLAGLIDRALEGNLSLQSAWDRLEQARAAARRAGADLYPSLDGEARAAETRGREDGLTGTRESYSLGIAAGYEADLWGRIRSSRDAAALDARASAEDLRTAALTLSSRVAATWYQLIEQYGQIRLLQEQLDINDKVLELITLRFRTGRVGIADVLQQRQLVESNRGEIALVEGRAEVLEHQLAILLGAPPMRKVAPAEVEFGKFPPLPETGLPAELVRSRPDVRGAWYSLQAADHRVAAAIADRFPRLSLAAGLDTSGGEVRDLFDNWLASLAANLVGPIFDGGRRRAEVERTRAVAAEALHSYGQTVLDSLGEVEDALSREQWQKVYIASLDQQLELAERAIERVRDRYLNGAVDYQRVLDALLSYQRLQRTRLTALRELFEFRIDLYRALGGGWEMERSNAEIASR
jgi:NodT family efflux transporter outer membrane factor (OMF) lipoprotein